VIVNGRSEENLKRAVASITSIGGSASSLQLDITDEAAVEKAFSSIREQYGRLDILVNNVVCVIAAGYSSLKWMRCPDLSMSISLLPFICAEKQRG
jgi:NADP-dependent 3-hydroxy acid dehydrogenase YdfG